MKQQTKGRLVEMTAEGVKLNGRHEVLLCGSLFYFRLPRAVWKDRIAKLKRAGYNCVDVYFPWNYHETADGAFDFSGDRDVRYFLEELNKAGIYVIARPGPYICSEWNGGGLPARILESGMPIRCADKTFVGEVEKWYAAILSQIAPYSYAGGGNIVLLQIENELDFFDCPDPRAYIAELVAIAKKYFSDIPCFCCAGQYDVERAGGNTPGAEATLNCYPDSKDNTFDAELWGYARKFEKRNKPLLVSETNRDHFLLRRELSCGAKLLGAYNQVAGVNFGYDQAVNNWGSPDALLATIYDFWSMIDSTGHYREEANEALRFAAFLRAVGEPIAAATVDNPIEPETSTFLTAAGGLRALKLAGGGTAVCVPNFGDAAGNIRFTCGEHTVQAAVDGMHAPFLLFDLPLSGYGIDGTLLYATCEPIRLDGKEIVLSGKGEIKIRIRGREKTFDDDGEIEGVKIRFETDRAALLTASQTVGGGDLPDIVKEYTTEPCTQFFTAEPPVMTEMPDPQGSTFGALGVTEGEVEYTLELPKGKALYVDHPCDIIRVDTDGGRGETMFADGRNMTVPPSENGVYTVTITKWGHSNFDDSQSPGLRISCKKGAVGFGSVIEEEKIGRCDFRLCDTFGTETIDLTAGMPVRIGIDKWNSTRKPVICSYSLPIRRKASRLVLKTAEDVDVAVYIDGKKAGECAFGVFELTEFCPEGTEKTLTLMYRKRVWTQHCGEARLLHIDPVSPTRVRALSAKQVLAMGKKGGKLELPLRVDRPTALCVRIRTDCESRVRIEGKNLLCTCVADGKALGRAVVHWERAPALTGGEPNEIYAFGGSGELYIYIEPLGSEAELRAIEQIC